jgi:hypothetical protein
VFQLYLLHTRFLNRAEKIGPVPIEGDHDKAQSLYWSYRGIAEKYQSRRIARLFEEAWKELVLESGNPWKARVLAALPNTMEDHQEMLNTGLVQLKTKQMVRSLEWLEEFGVCADNMRTKESTLPQAGHGVFANRPLKKDAVILPVPLIHIPHRAILDLYDMDTSQFAPEPNIDFTKVTRKQLLLNYCLGHPDSTMLLSPYGPVFPLINHNQTLANVRLQWADPKRSSHRPELLTYPVDSFFEITNSQLAMELIALRDIQPDEEILLDYGDAWEAAWHEHVRNWKPVEGAQYYVSAEMINEEPDPLPTEFEKIYSPYPKNVQLLFDNKFRTDEWKEHNKDVATLHAFTIKQTYSDWVECEILSYEISDTVREDGTLPTLYTVVVTEDNVSEVVKGVPRESIVHVNRPYSSDMFLPNAFRHEIHVPIFPEAWKNSQTKEPQTTTTDTDL